MEAQQVIYAGGAISSGIKQAEMSKLLAELDLQKNVQEIRFLLVGHYLNLYKLDNQIVVLRKNIELTNQVIANMVARREQGTVLKTILLVMSCKRAAQFAIDQDYKCQANCQSSAGHNITFAR